MASERIAQQNNLNQVSRESELMNSFGTLDADIPMPAPAVYIASAESQIAHTYLNDVWGGGRCLMRVNGDYWAWTSGRWRPMLAADLYTGMLDLADEVLIQGHRNTALADWIQGDPESKKPTSRSPVSVARKGQDHLARLVCRDPDSDPIGLMRRIIPPIVNARNGEVYFDGGVPVMRDALPETLSMNRLQVDYIPDADTIFYDAYLDLLTDGCEDPPAIRSLIDEICGYALTTWRDISTIVVLKGDAGAGKTTLSALLSSVIGDAILIGDSVDIGEDAHALAAFVGKQVFVDDDLASKRPISAAWLRQCSEVKQVSANPKGKSRFSFISRIFPILITNHWPRLDEAGEAIARRLIALDLSGIPANKRSEAARAALMRHGLEGALRRWIDGLGRLVRRGAWDLPSECWTWRNECLGNASDVAAWATLRLSRYDGNRLLSLRDAYESYLTYMGSDQPGAKVLGKIRFASELDAVIGRRMKTVGKWGWRGWGITT